MLTFPHDMPLRTSLDPYWFVVVVVFQIVRAIWNVLDETIKEWRDLKCCVCSLIFTWNFHLKYHARQQHTDIEPVLHQCRLWTTNWNVTELDMKPLQNFNSSSVIGTISGTNTVHKTSYFHCYWFVHIHTLPKGATFSEFLSPASSVFKKYIYLFIY